MSATAKCPHTFMDFQIDAKGFDETNILMLKLTARCKACGEPLTFVCDGGSSIEEFNRPQTNRRRTTLFIPVVPIGEKRVAPVAAPVATTRQ